jgi:DNA-binding transcriptional MerR regulator
VSERPYLSIGEVLALLKDEFPDVTISKIRFLESQGLLDPERTPSGYRKFYDTDVERLRWILRQQREHFLPLKVIKGRLGTDEPEAPEPVPVASAAPAAAQSAAPAAPAPPVAAERPLSVAREVVAVGEVPGNRRPAGASAGAPAPAAEPIEGNEPALSAGPTAVALTLEELAAASGLLTADLTELERFGLLAGRPVAGVVYYDEDALLVARLAAGFRKHGVEARHLRMYRTAAEREASFLEQVVTPLLKQRNPEARRQAMQSLEELARLGQKLRGAQLRLLLREHRQAP